MAYAVFVGVSIVLFIGFLALTRYEARRGTRFFAGSRAFLDTEAARVSFAFSHVDVPAFIRESLRTLVARIVHDIAHGSLIAVRFLERLLTRVVRALRTRHGAVLMEEQKKQGPTAFVATMADFKQGLKNGRKTEETNGDIIGGGRK